MTKAIHTALYTCFLFYAAIALEARQPYKAIVTVEDTSGTVSAPNLLDLKRELSTSNLAELIPLYTPTAPASLRIDLRGVLAAGTFAANSTAFVVTLPQTGVTEVFTGATREESIGLFKEYVRDGGTHHNLLRAYARYSPIDPIAGNPNSLMALMGQADYLAGHLSPFSGCSSCWGAQPLVHQVQGGVYASRAFDGGFDATAVTIPLRYSYASDLTQAIILDAPITYLRNGGASSLVTSLGIGMRIPITLEWSMTPIFRFGGGGSLDLCTSGVFISGGMTSVFNYKLCGYVLSLTNYASYMSSANLWLSGVNFNYHLHTYIFKNGLALTSCEALCLWGRALNFSLSIVDSYFTRNRLYIRHYDEVSASVITNYINPYLCYDCLELTFSYQFGQHRLKGYTVKMAYQF